MEPLQLSMWTYYGRGFRWKGFHLHGRACKIYTKMTNGRWKIISHIGI
jgi:ketosteroid isomerase-like protein